MTNLGMSDGASSIAPASATDDGATAAATTAATPAGASADTKNSPARETRQKVQEDRLQQLSPAKSIKSIGSSAHKQTSPLAEAAQPKAAQPKARAAPPPPADGQTSDTNQTKIPFKAAPAKQIPEKVDGIMVQLAQKKAERARKNADQEAARARTKANNEKIRRKDAKARKEVGLLPHSSALNGTTTEPEVPVSPTAAKSIMSDNKLAMISAAASNAGCTGFSPPDTTPDCKVPQYSQTTIRTKKNIDEVITRVVTAENQAALAIGADGVLGQTKIILDDDDVNHLVDFCKQAYKSLATRITREAKDEARKRQKSTRGHGSSKESLNHIEGWKSFQPMHDWAAFPFEGTYVPNVRHVASRAVAMKDNVMEKIEQIRKKVKKDAKQQEKDEASKQLRELHANHTRAFLRALADIAARASFCRATPAAPRDWLEGAPDDDLPPSAFTAGFVIDILNLYFQGAGQTEIGKIMNSFTLGDTPEDNRNAAVRSWSYTFTTGTTADLLGGDKEVNFNTASANNSDAVLSNQFRQMIPRRRGNPYIVTRVMNVHGQLSPEPEPVAMRTFSIHQNTIRIAPANSRQTVFLLHQAQATSATDSEFYSAVIAENENTSAAVKADVVMSVFAKSNKSKTISAKNTLTGLTAVSGFEAVAFAALHYQTEGEHVNFIATHDEKSFAEQGVAASMQEGQRIKRIATTTHRTRSNSPRTTLFYMAVFDPIMSRGYGTISNFAVHGEPEQQADSAEIQPLKFSAFVKQTVLKKALLAPPSDHAVKMLSNIVGTNTISERTLNILADACQHFQDNSVGPDAYTMFQSPKIPIAALSTGASNAYREVVASFCFSPVNSSGNEELIERVRLHNKTIEELREKMAADADEAKSQTESMREQMRKQVRAQIEFNTNCNAQHEAAVKEAAQAAELRQQRAVTEAVASEIQSQNEHIKILKQKFDEEKASLAKSHETQQQKVVQEATAQEALKQSAALAAATAKIAALEQDVESLSQQITSGMAGVSINNNQNQKQQQQTQTQAKAGKEVNANQSTLKTFQKAAPSTVGENDTHDALEAFELGAVHVEAPASVGSGDSAFVDVGDPFAQLMPEDRQERQIGHIPAGPKLPGIFGSSANLTKQAVKAEKTWAAVAKVAGEGAKGPISSSMQHAPGKIDATASATRAAHNLGSANPAAGGESDEEFSC